MAGFWSFSAGHHHKAGVVAVRMANQGGEYRASSAYGKAPTNQLCPQQTWKSGRQAGIAKTKRKGSPRNDLVQNHFCSCVN